MELSAYRVAYEAANSEFREILQRFDYLSVRKNQLEKAVDALRPLARSDGDRGAIKQHAENLAVEQVQHVAEVPSAPVQEAAAPALDRMQHEEISAPEAVQQAAAPLPGPLQQDEFPELEGVQQEEEEVSSFDASSDPIQRRIDSALKHRSSFRGIREYSHGVGARL